MVEGAKSVQELLTSDFEVLQVLGTPEFLATATTYRGPTVEVRERDLEGLGEFQSNNSALAVARMKANQAFSVSEGEFALVLDDIRDPGNLGTIVRTADWYGVNKIIASEETADFYNGKVITSSMGSFTRVNVFYTDLQEYLASVHQPVYGAYLNGDNIHNSRFGSGGLIVIGNESHGISPALEKFITKRISIPRIGKAESLNAAIATAVILDNMRRP